MEHRTAASIIHEWPAPSREAAQLVIDKYGEPHEVSESFLVWHRVGPWKRLVATSVFHRHDFPAPHDDVIEAVIDYRVPPDKLGAIAMFDGSVVVERTVGEVSARCHDEEANLLALNLMHDIIAGTKTLDEARAYYAKEFLDHRRKLPTPYMEGLRFETTASADPDVRVLSDNDIARAVKEGEQGKSATADALTGSLS